MRSLHCLFYNCPEIVDSVDNPLVDNRLVDNRLAEELVAGIAEVGEGGYSTLEEEEGDIPYWEGEEVLVAPTEGEGVCSHSRFVGVVHRPDIGSRTC